MISFYSMYKLIEYNFNNKPNIDYNDVIIGIKRTLKLIFKHF